MDKREHNGASGAIERARFPFAIETASEEDDGRLRIRGVANTFGIMRSGRIIHPSAVENWIAQNRDARPQLLVNHGVDVGGLATIGKVESLTVDRARGLCFTAWLASGTRMAYVDRWMLSNNSLAMALGDYVAGELGHTLAWATDRNGLMGDGGAAYARCTGLFNLDGYNVTADSGDDTFAEVIAANVKYPTQVAGQLPETGDDEHCKWYMHRSIFWGFVGTRDANDRPVADILTNEGKPQRILCGYPVEVTPVAPQLSGSAASKVMAVLANLMRGTEIYRFGGGAELRVSEHVKFLEGEVAMLLDVLQGLAHVDESMSVRLKTAAS